MPPLLYPILSALFYAQVIFFTQILVAKTNKPILSGFWFQIFASAFFIPLFLLDKPNWEISMASFILLIATSIFYFLFTAFGFTSQKLIDVSITGVLGQITLVFTFVGSVLLFDEGMNFQKLIGVGLILLGNVSLFLRKNSSVKINRKGLILRILASITLGSAILIDAKNSSKFSLTLYGFFTYFLPAILIALYTRDNFKEYKKVLANNTPGLILTGLFGTAGYWFLIKSFTELDKSIAVPINNSFSVIVVLMGIAFLKERTDMKRKILTALVVFGGVVLLGSS